VKFVFSSFYDNSGLSTAKRKYNVRGSANYLHPLGRCHKGLPPNLYMAFPIFLTSKGSITWLLIVKHNLIILQTIHTYRKMYRYYPISWLSRSPFSLIFLVAFYFQKKQLYVVSKPECKPYNKLISTSAV